jgi:hypothetical protein
MLEVKSAETRSGEVFAENLVVFAEEDVILLNARGEVSL